MSQINQLFISAKKQVGKLRPALVGLSTLVPGVNTLRSRVRNIGGGASARYCYSIWLRHAVLLAQHGATLKGAKIAELGPGDSLGIGLACLLSGASRYTALDVVKYTDLSANHQILEQLAELLATRAPIPGSDEYPAVEPKLADYRFPAALFSDVDLADLGVRTQNLHDALDGKKADLLEYCVPWHTRSALKPASLDIILSQAVLQSIDDLAGTYEMMHAWLKPGGFMSHSIDFGSLSLAQTWDGHRAYGDMWWAIVKGRRSHSLNRLTLSDHLALLSKCGFEILYVQTVADTPTLPKNVLAKRFRNLDARDLTTRVAFIIARKPSA